MTSDEEAILFYAFRYACGRMTYAVKQVADAICAKRDQFSESTAEVIMREIEEKRKNKELGMDMDVEQWERVYNALAYNSSGKNRRKYDR